MSNSGVIKATVGAVLGLGVVALLQFTIFNKSFMASHNHVEDVKDELSVMGNNATNTLLDQIAKEVNKSCPKTVDSETRLDSAEGLPGNRFVYDYCLVNKELSSTDTSSYRQQMEPTILSNVKTNAAFEYFRSNNVTMVFKFRDKNGKELVAITVTPEQYNN